MGNGGEGGAYEMNVCMGAVSEYILVLDKNDWLIL